MLLGCQWGNLGKWRQHFSLRIVSSFLQTADARLMVLNCLKFAVRDAFGTGVTIVQHNRQEPEQFKGKG